MQNNQQNGQFYYPGQQGYEAEKPIQQEQPPQTNPDEQYAAQNEEYDEPIHWTASEFVQHDKSFLWYALLALATAAVATAAYFILKKDIFVPSIVLILGVVFGVAGSRKPRVLDYAIDDDGIVVDQKHFRYEEFKFFSLISEGPVSTVLLMPTKRFSPALTLYVPEEGLDAVLDSLSIVLPHEEHDVGYFYKFLSKIKF